MKKFISILITVILTVSLFPVLAENEVIPAYDFIQAESEEQQKIEDAEDVEELNSEFFANGDASLSYYGAETAIISGNVLIPDGASANEGDQLEISFYESPEISDGKVISESDSSVKKEKITLSAGQTEAAFSSVLPDGDYIIQVRYVTGNKSINGAYSYYDGDGMTENEYLAKSIKAGSVEAQNLSMTLLKADSYISGTIDLTDCIPDEDTYIWMRAEASSGAHYQCVYVNTLVKKGETSCDYEIGLDKELFQLQFSSDIFRTGYYSTGTLNSSYNKKSLLDTQNPIDNLDVKIPAQNETEMYNVKINFDSPLAEERKYIVELLSFEDFNNYTLIDDMWVTAENGATSISASFPVQEDYDKIVLMYREVVTSSVSFNPDRVSYYYSQEKGITTDPSSATNIVGMTNIEITEPEFISVKGVLNIKGDVVNTGQFMHVGADFGSESYSDIIMVSGRENSFDIRVPKSLVGKNFTVFTGLDRFTTLDERAVVSTGISCTLDENMQTLSVDSAVFSPLSGKIILPFEAPHSGAIIDLSLYIDGYWIEYGNYVIAAGETEISYSIAVPDSIKERAEISATLRIYEYENISKEFRSEQFTAIKDIDITFYETVDISGTISLPQGVTYQDATSVYVSVQGIGGSIGSYFSIPAGESSVPYVIKVAKDQTISHMYVWLPEEKVNLFRYSYYAGDGAMSGSNKTISLSLAEDTVINLSVLKSSSIAGTITLPAEAKYTEGTLNFGMYFESVTTGERYNSYHYDINPADKTAFMVTVPAGDDTYKLSINVWGSDDSNVVKSAYMYYNGSSFSSDKDDAQGISVKDDYELYFPVYETIKGTLSFPQGTYINDPGMTVSIYAKNTKTNSTVSKSFNNFADEKGMSFEIPVPPNNNTYKVYCYIGAYSCDTNIVSGYYYYSTEGTVSAEANASEVSLGAQNVTITPSRLYNLSGKLNVPADYEYIEKITKATIKLYNAETGGYIAQTTANVDENLNYTALLPKDKTGNIIFSVTPENKAVNNLVNKEYKLTQAVNVAASDISGVNFTLETGYKLTGSIKLPDDAVLSGVTYTPSVNAGTSLKTSQITAEKRSAQFMVGIDKSKTSVGVMATLNSPVKESVYTTNLYSGTVYYISDTNSSTTYTSEGKINTSSIPQNITILMHTCAKFNFTLSKPSDVNSLTATAYIEDENGIILTYKSLYLSGSSTVITEDKELDKKYIGTKAYVYYTISSGPDNAYKQKVYVNPDGSFGCFKKDAIMHTIREQNNIELQMITTDNPIVPTYEFESLHKDSSNSNKDYTYTHSTAADYLEVTFSEDTDFYRITIYDKDNVKIDEYSNKSLAGKTIKIKGNSFKINLQSSSPATYYGFAADVTAHNYLLKSEHPLTPNNETRYEYTHTTDADWLDITFSEETMLSDWNIAQLNIDSTDGNIQGFSNDELSGKTVRVSGNSFVIRVNTYNCSNVYGFDVEKIVPGYKVWHNVTFKNYDGSVLCTQRVEDGLEAIYMGITPYKEMNGEKAYKFKCWDKSLTNITDSITVTAQFEEITPIYISTEAELKAIKNNMEGYYILKNDIALKEAWTPLAAELEPENAFKGVFEGNGHIISDVNIPAENKATPEMAYRGFFTWLENAVVRNLGIQNISFGGETDHHDFPVEVGGFACNIMRSLVENCFVQGSISTGSSMPLHAGGFAGSVCDSIITNSYSDVDLTLRGHTTAGGFAGDINMSNVSNCFAYGKVSSDENTDPLMEDRIGAFCGMLPVNMETVVSNIYYISDYYTDSTHYGTPISKENVKTTEGFKASTGEYVLDFENIWTIDDRIAEHPVLRYQTKSLRNEDCITAVVRDLVKEGKLSVNCSAPSYEKGIFIISAYKGAKMVGTTNSGNGEFAKSGTGEIFYKADEKPDRIKVMFWTYTSGIKPLCKETAILSSEWETE